MPIHLYIVYSYFYTTMAELSSCHITCLTHKVIYKKFTILPFVENVCQLPVECWSGSPYHISI